MKQNGRACLDAIAWLAWLQDEPGAAAVQHWLDAAEAARAECVTSVINLGEAYYRLVRVEQRDEAESLWRTAPTMHRLQLLLMGAARKAGFTRNLLT